MKKLGLLLMLIGAGIGSVVVLGMIGEFHLALPWLVNVALAKLTLVASGVIAVGGVVRRIGARRADAARIGGSDLDSWA